MNTRKILQCLGFILLCEAAGGIGSIFTASPVRTWYVTLARPALSPPNWVFGPVWTTLYALMGIALFLVVQKGWNRKDVQKAVALFAIQLVLNVLWSLIFFGWHNPGGALIDIALMWLAILATIMSFFKISRTAAWLLVPYLLWVSFASYLNFMIWRLN